MDIETIERYLSDASLGKRIEAIEFLRSSLREESRSAVLNSFSAKVVILRALERCLADRNWEIRHKSIQFLNEILERDQYSADQYMFSVVPPLILCVADPKITVRRVALQTIHCYLRYANDRKLAVYSIVKYGLDNEDIAVQRDWCVALPVVLTAEQAELDYSEIIQSLVRKLDAPELSETALKVLQHISNLVGTQRFYDTVKRLPHSVRVAYARFDSNVATMLTPSPAAGMRASAMSFTADSAARRASNSTDSLLDSTLNFREDPRMAPEEIGNSARRVGEPTRVPDSDSFASNIATSNRYPPAGNLGATSNRGRQNDDVAREQMLKQFVSEHPPDAAAKLNVRRIVAQEVQSDESETDEDEDEDEEVKFGCLPVTIGNMLENENDAKAHLGGGEELKKLVQTLSGDDMRRMEPHLLGFLSYLNSFLDDPNLRFTMLILESLEILVIKLASYMLTTTASRGSVQAGIETNLYVRHILAILMKRLSENKNILRQTAFKMIAQLMHIFQKPMLIVDQLTALNFFMHRNSRVRQETLNLLIVALLTYPSNMFDLAKMSRLVVGLLVDAKRQVRLAAFECIAVLAQALGSGNRHILLNAVDQIELEQVTVTNACTNQNQQADNDDVSLMSAVQARLARRQLPRLIRPSSSSFGNPSTTEFDMHIEYALQLPTAGQLRQFPFATLSADIKWIAAAATGSSSTVPSAQLTPGPAASQQTNGSNVEPHRPIQAWSSPDPSTEKPNGAQKTTARQLEGAAPAQNEGPPANGQSRIGSGSLRYSASKLRKLLPWEQDASGTSPVKNEKPTSNTPPTSDTQQKQPFSKYFSSVEPEAATKPTVNAQQPPQQNAPSNTKQPEKATGSVREQLQQLNATAHAESVKKPPAAKAKVQAEASSKAPIQTQAQAQAQAQTQKPNPTHAPAPPAAVSGKTSKTDETPLLPHPPTAPKNQNQLQAATSNADIADVGKSTTVPIKRRSLSNEGKSSAQAAQEKPESLNVATSTTQLVQQSSTNNANAAAVRVDQSTSNKLPQNRVAAPNTPAVAVAVVAAATRQSSNDVRESVQTSTVAARKQPIEEQVTPDFAEADNESLHQNAVHKSVSTPSFAALAKGSQIPIGVSSQQSPLRRVSLFDPEPAPVSNEMALNKTITTNNSARQKVPQLPAADDSVESDDSDMEQAIQSIRSSAAKKRAERLERLKQAASESHSAPPHSTHGNYFQHQMSLPNSSYIDDGEDDEPLEFNEEDDDDDGSTLEDTDEERDDGTGSARSRMSQKLVNSMNRKQQEVIHRQVSQVERSRHTEKQEDTTSSQSASSTLRKPPSGPVQKNALNRSQFSSSPNLATGSLTGQSKSAGATASADDEQMMRDLQFISDKPPTELLRMALNGMSNQNQEMWEEKCRCLNIVRFLAREHTKFLQSEYRTIRLPILREVRNLRTQVNRVALHLFGDLFEYLGKVTEIDLDSTIEHLLPRSGDTNKFIQQEVQNTLMRFVRFVSPTAAIPTLIQIGSTHRNALVRRTTAQFIAVSVERYVGMQTNRTALHDSVQAYAAAASEDADPGCRQHGRRIIAALNGSPQGQDSNNNADRKQTSSAPVSKMSNGRTKKNSLGATGGAQPPANTADASTILTDLQASDAQTRIRGIDAYQQYLARGEVSAEHFRAFQQFCKSLTDQNDRVSFRALQAFSALYKAIFQQITFDEKPQSRDALPLRTCIDALLPHLGNQNEQAFALANNILDDFIGDLLENATELIAPICTYYQVAPNDVVRAYLLEKLSYIVPRTYSKRAVVIQSSLIPFVWNALNTLCPAFVRDRESGQQSSARAGGEVERVKLAFAKLLKSLYRQMKDDLVVSLERQKSGKAEQLITLLTEQHLSLKDFVGKIAT